MNTKKWTTREGTKIRVKDMDDSHLLNTVKLIERRSRNLHHNSLMACFEAQDFFTADIASMQLEQEEMRIMEGGFEKYLPDIYFDMKDELSRRKLS